MGILIQFVPAFINQDRRPAINALRNEENTHENEVNPYYNNKHIIRYLAEVKDGWTIKITFTADIQKGENKYLPDFEKILSSFKINNISKTNI